MKGRERITIAAFTDPALEVAETVGEILGHEGYEGVVTDGRKLRLRDRMEEIFKSSSFIVFVSACGIAVRMTAPHIRSKDTDPGIIVIDEKKQFVISLLSGHLGGANELAERLAQGLGAVPVITTATDLSGRFAVDLWTKRAGCAIEDISKIKHISSAVLKGEKVGLYSDFDIEGALPEELYMGDSGAFGIAVSLSGTCSPFDETLNAVPGIVSMGAGCRRDTDPDRFKEFALETLAERDISLKSIESVSSIDLKADELCLKSFSEELGIPFLTYSASQLNEAGDEDSVGRPFGGSDFVRRTTGTDNVCERSAFLSSGKGKIILEKTGRDGMTLALAERDWKCKF